MNPLVFKVDVCIRNILRQFAAERAELRERGAALDADIGRQEKDVSALEATLRVVHHAHSHFMHHISPLKDDSTLF